MNCFSHPLRTLTKTVLVAAITAAIGSIHALAGHELEVKETVAPAPEAPYEAGRGLITLEGPSGMFINPTSATLPKGAFTIQYCILFPNQDTDVVGHGIMLAYGITDWLEIGATGNLVDLNAGVDKLLAAGGPLIRIRLLRDREWWPQLSVGAYAKWGSHLLNQYTAFAAAYKRIPISDTFFIRSVGFHAGVRESWFDEDVPESNSFNAYFGTEVQLPYRIYLVGELGTKGNNRFTRNQDNPYAFGIQWRLGGVNLSVAGLQAGDQGRIGIWSGFAFSHDL